MTNQTIENVKAYLLENMDEVRSIVSELNSWNGCLESLEVFENDEEFFNMFFEGKAMEAVRAAHYGDYNYMDAYVRFNGYGNLESFGDYELEKDYKDSIDEIIELMIENRSHVYLSSELEELLNEEETEE
jgi:hypothetical protein